MYQLLPSIRTRFARPNKHFHDNNIKFNEQSIKFESKFDEQQIKCESNFSELKEQNNELKSNFSEMKEQNNELKLSLIHI